MKKLLCGLGIVGAISLPAAAHDEALDEAVLKELFPKAISFLERKKVLSTEEIKRVEEAAQDRVRDTDITLTYWVALTIDEQSEKTRSVGAVLMVDAGPPGGLIELVVAYNQDGSVRKVLALEGQSSPEIASQAYWRQLEGRTPTDGWDPEVDFELPAEPAEARAIIRAVRRGMHLYLTLVDR